MAYRLSLSGEKNDRINPDNLYLYGSEQVTFIYTIDGDLIADLDSELTHADLLSSNRLEKYNPPDSGRSLRGWSLKIALLGRAGRHPNSDNYIVSFWNTNSEMYSLLDDCIEALKHGQISRRRLEKRRPFIPNVPVEIHTPFDVTMFDGSGETKKPDVTDLDPEVAEKYRLQQELHLMRGDEKKAALKKLGLWNDRTAKHPMAKELEKAGELGPGQKWWATQSDDIKKLSDTISEDLV